MSYGEVFRPREVVLAIDAPTSERAAFIVRTYLHLLGAVMAFVALEALLLSMPFTGRLVEIMISGAGGYSWLLVLGAFMVVSWIANSWAQSATSLPVQYAGLSLFVVAESVLFLPLLYVAYYYGGPGVIPSAAVTTVLAFAGLTAIVFVWRKDLSAMGPYLSIAGIVALGLIVCSILFGFNLGVLFTVLMIGFACTYILYDTSMVLHTYRTDQHVAASLALFAAVALLFWYVLRLFMSRD